MSRLLGTDLGPDAQAALLARVGIASERSVPGSEVVIAAGSMPLSVPAAPGEARDGIVPTWRRDILVEADLAEEVVRLEGYETVVGKTRTRQCPTSARTRWSCATRSARRSPGRA